MTGLVVLDVVSPFFMQAARAVEREGARRARDPLCNSENDADRETDSSTSATAQPVYRGLNRAGVKVSLTQLAALAAQ